MAKSREDILQDKLETPALFIGNLSYDTKEKQLISFLTMSLGVEKEVIQKVTVARDKETGKSKGYAYIDLSQDVESVLVGIQEAKQKSERKDPMKLQGRTVEIMDAKFKRQMALKRLEEKKD